MCGIIAIFNRDRVQAVSPDLLVRMCNSISHRGPDDEGQYYYRNMGIGVRRLSIIDVQTGHQPIANEDGTIWVVLNGEIYNYPALREQLIRKGYKFRTRSDTECIVHLYEEYGEDCVQHLRGMFAFAILDQRKESLFLARDRLGIKPLFYCVTPRRIAFASEIKALLQDRTIATELDLTALDAYLTYTYIPAPLTIFSTIRKLEPGHSVRCTADDITIRRYWELHFEPDHARSAEDFSEEFLHLFDESVRIHLLSDVPLGAFLSGGIDSGMVVAFMARHCTTPVKTFTIGFGGSVGGYLDERVYARAVAERYGLDHQEFEVQPKLEDILDYVVTAFDEPFADDSVVPTYYICKIARQQVTVALTGLGGDELFAGYERYLGLALSASYRRLPRFVTSGLIRPLVEHLPEHLGGHHSINHMKRFVRSADMEAPKRYQGFLAVLDRPAKKDLYSENLFQTAEKGMARELGTRHFASVDNTNHLIDRALQQDFNMYLPDDILALSDRLSMHHSLELRVPFLDHKLVEFCARIPASLKLRWGRKKYLLKKIASSFLPHGTLSHRKQGFESPMSYWLRHDLKNYAMELLSEKNLQSHGLFRAESVRRLLDDHFTGREANEKLLFALMVFQRWHDAYT